MGDKFVIEASHAVAEAVKLSDVGVIPMYPITPQTHIVEKLADFISDGDINAKMVHAESEHSAISIALGSVASGVRSFTATSSQGLALMNEILHVFSGLRLPFVMVVANRALSAPINIWNDHQDAISVKDTGWIQLHVENAQEALDTVIQAYKISENKEVLLPVMVNMDGFVLSHVYEPVTIPKKSKVNKFLQKFKPQFYLDPKKPITMGSLADPDWYMEIKYTQMKAFRNAINVIKKVNNQYKRSFGRSYGNGLVETYNMNGAKYIIVCMGSVCGTVRYVIDNLRKKAKKWRNIGMIKVKSYRPFPEDDIKKLCKNVKSIGVIDKDMPYFGGSLYEDIRATLADKKKKISNFVVGLGGRDVRIEHIEKIFNRLTKNKVGEEWMF